MKFIKIQTARQYLQKKAVFLNLLANSFSYFILVVCNVWYNALGRFCYKVVILSSTRK